MSERVRILDTTLRDGEQSAGLHLSPLEKLAIAERLGRLNVDIIEAGFPASSPLEFEAVSRIAEKLGNSDGPVIAGLARVLLSDIDSCWQAVRHARQPRIHLFIATSDLHLRHKLCFSRTDLLGCVHRMVSEARSRCADVQFSAEDATRTDPSFLYEVLHAAIDAGATTLNIPDTLGCSAPDEYGTLVRSIRACVPGIEGCVLSVHCHDDLGLATANTVAGLHAGARQAELTINGLGERAGNAALEEVALLLRTRYERYHLTTRLDLTHLFGTSRFVSELTGISVPPNKAIVGKNAFAHEAGIHQDGLLKDRRTYEFLDPRTVGRGTSQLVLGKHSGRRAYRVWLSADRKGNLTQEHNRGFSEFIRPVKNRKAPMNDASWGRLLSLPNRNGTEFNVDSVSLANTHRSEVRATVVATVSREHRLSVKKSGASSIDALFGAIQEMMSVPQDDCEYILKPLRRLDDGVIECVVGVRYHDHAVEIHYGYAVHNDANVALARAFAEALKKHYSACRVSDDGSFSIAPSPTTVME